MVLFRHNAPTFEESMAQMKIFETTRDINNYLIDYHNLYNIVRSSKTGFIFKGSREVQNDTRNNWAHSRLLFMGQVPLGIFDSETLRSVKVPDIVIDNDINGGLKCQFELMDEGYVFYLGTDQWSDHSTCKGFHCRIMNQPFFQMDDVPVMRPVFRQLLYSFIAKTAIKKMGFTQAVAEFKAKRKEKII